VLPDFSPSEGFKAHTTISWNSDYRIHELGWINGPRLPIIQWLGLTVVLPSSNFLGLLDFRPREFPHLFPPNLPTSEISISFTLRAHIVQLSPITTVARGMLRRVHVTFGDVIGSYHVHFSFRDFGFREFVHQHISLFPVAEITKLRFTFFLIQRSSFLPLIYGVDHFRTSEFWASGVRASHISLFSIAEIAKGFQDNSPAPSLDLTVMRDFLSSRTDSMAPTLHALSSLSLSLAKYHIDCGLFFFFFFLIIPLHLLSFVTRPSNPLALRNNLRFEISPSRPNFYLKLRVQWPLIWPI
jgi:hypothetical protein